MTEWFVCRRRGRCRRHGEGSRARCAHSVEDLEQGRSWQCAALGGWHDEDDLDVEAAGAETMLLALLVTDDEKVGAGDAACHHCLVHGGEPLAVRRTPLAGREMRRLTGRKEYVHATATAPDDGRHSVAAPQEGRRWEGISRADFRSNS